MRVNTQKLQKIQQIGKTISLVARKAKDYASLGLSGRQWLASFVICLMLMPIFSLPVGATIYLPKSDPNISQFEPVNAELPIWETLRINLSAKVEEWTTPMREVNVIHDENDKKKKSADEKTSDNDKKKTSKKKNKKSKSNESDVAETSNTSLITDSDEPINSNVKSENNAIVNSVTGKTAEIKTSETTESGKIIKERNSNSTELAAKKSPVASALLLNQLPDDEQGSTYNYENNLGSPPGQVEMDSSNEAAALRIRHRAGIANFSFGLPLASLSGRGIDAGASMTYNSRTWNKSTNASNQNHFTYDVEQSWIAPGFSSGFGYLESRVQPLYYNGSIYAYKTYPTGLIEADGTRRQVYCSQTSGSACLAYETSDGSFIRFSGQVINSIPANATFSATYPNGSKVYFAGAFGTDNYRKHYPVILQNSNGNRVRIAYKTDQSGRIDYIRDTLNRDIKFYYGTDASGNTNKLVAVTIPGMNTGDEIQTVRFYYENLTLNTQNAFSGQVTAPTVPIQVLRFVYFPATKTGFKYDYHPNYGMIKKISRQVGMAVSDQTSTSTTGTVTNEGIWAATTEYDFPDGSTALSDAPKYTKRTDDWQGRTSGSVAETLYDAPEPATGADRISSVSVSDKEYNPATDTYSDFKIINETISHNTNDWMNGLIKETSVKKKFGPAEQYTTVMSKTKYFWEEGLSASGNRRNPILRKVEITNDAGQTKTTRYEYDQYNNQTAIEDYNFGQNEANATPLRRIEIAYETGSGWIGANLLGLTKSVQTKVGGAVVSKTLYEYDNNGSYSYTPETLRSDISTTTHDTFYNPAYPAHYERVCPNGEIGEAPQGAAPESDPNGCTTIYHPGYGAASVFRGNITKVGRMLDVNAATMDSNRDDVTNFEYDIAGNTVSATLSCCQLKTLNYGESFAETGYAYPVKETKGSSPQLVNKVVYNYNTGLVTSSTNENNQITNYQYEPDTLRQKKTIYPNGGYVETEYSDKLAPGTPIGFIRTTTALEANKTTQSYNYYDGSGQGIRSATETPDGWNVAAVEYDKLGRPVKSYNPFYSSTPNGAIPGGTKFTQVLNYDALGRTTSVRLQDLTTISTAFSDVNTTPAGFNKTFVTVTDQAGKQRRQLADALGRIVRVDEPNKTSGNLGAVDAPVQPTSYEYDGNDNLSKVIQTDGAVTQERKFKYDSLSRLTHEKQVEANATLDNNGIKGTSDPNKWTKVLKYNTDGLLTEGTDARGVKTTFSYDGLNRVQSVSFSDGTPNVTYTYDQIRASFFNKGALTRVETTAGGTLRPDTPATATEFDYDLMGRLKAHRQIIGTQTYNLEYGYNLAGQLISEKYPSGRVVSMNYDANGRLSQIADASRTYLSGLQFQGKGTALSEFNLGNGTNQTFSYNDRLQMENQILSKNVEILQKYNYNYGQTDSNGILKNNGKLAQVESFIGSQKQWTQKFSYDAIGRLSEASEQRGDTDALSYKQKFDFDNFGNLYRKQANNPTGQQNPLPTSWIEDNQIDKTTNRFSSSTGTVYDDAGNVTTDTKFRNLNYSYDANGRMYKTSTISGTNQSNAVYDASGKRVAQQIDGVWTFFIYDAFGKMIAEYGGLQATDEGGVKYVLSDWQGSSRAIVGQNGVIKARMDYTTFGEEIQAGTGLRTSAQGFNGNSNLDQKYSRTERDKATGLDHTWFRKLENQAGRWTSPDPYNGSARLGNPQSFNRYSYVENQPTNFIDPSGLNLEAPGSGGYCIRYHYTNGVIGFWGGWTCYGGNSDSGGGGGGGGNGQGNGQSQNSVSENCKKAISALGNGIWEKVEALLKNAPLFDIEALPSLFGASASLRLGDLTSSATDDLGSFYFGDYANLGETVGETFDRNTEGGQGAWTVRARGGITGIYYRGSRTNFSNMNFLLHEIVHLVFPEVLSGTVDLDEKLVSALGITRDSGQTYSDAVSRWFNSGCDAKYGGQIIEEP